MVERAWAAGFFDGEGCTTLAREKAKTTQGYRSYVRIKISIGQCHVEVLERFKAAVGEGHIYGPYTKKSTKLPYWQYMTHGPRAVGVLIKLWPYLGTEKKNQASRQLLAYELHLDSFVEMKKGPKPKQKEAL